MHLLTFGIALMALSTIQLCAAGGEELSKLGDSGRHEFTFPELYKLLDRFWDTFVNGAAKEVKAGNSSLFNPNIQGRVDITRTFSGIELNTEYLFGMFENIKNSAANSSEPPSSVLGYPDGYRIQSFVGNRDIASASTIVNFTSPLMGTVPVEILTWMQFDDGGRIAEYDATYRSFGPLLQETLMAVLPRINGASLNDAVAYFHKSLTDSICATHERHCTGSMQQYASEFACRAFLTNDVRFGEAWEFGRNTLLCRSLHQNMISYRPEIHCPHIGPSGGGMCIDDLDYKGLVSQRYFKTHFLPWETQCKPVVPFMLHATSPC